MKRLSLIAFLSLFSIASQAEVLVLNGVYQGRDIYIKNPFSGDGVGFCVFEVLVNGKMTSDEVNSSAFAVDLSLFEMNIGDPVEIVIRSKADCQPKVINPGAIKPRSTFEITGIDVNNELDLNWTTTSESGALPFVIEQFKWNKWVKIGEVMGEGDEGPNDYLFRVKVTAGENDFRVRQTDTEGTRTSSKVTIQSEKAPVEILNKKVFDVLEFAQETQYEVFDEFGLLTAQGFGSYVDLSDKSKGKYYVNYGAKFGEVILKK